jgi:hypothetical protein
MGSGGLLDVCGGGGVAMQVERIRVSAELFPNLVLHVLACAGIGLDMDYGQRFQETLNGAEISQVQELAAGFHVQPPAVAGPFFQVLFQMPCYFPAESVAEVESIYRQMVQVVQEGSIVPLSRTHPQQVRRFARYVPPHMQKLLFAESQARATDLEEAIARFSQVVGAVCRRHYVQYWCDAKRRLERFGVEILQKIGTMDLVGAWETAVGREFPYPHFHVILGESTRFLGTSLLAEKGVFSAVLPVELVVESIVHEVGTHIIPIYADERLQRAVLKDHSGLVRVVEAACQLLRRPILAKMGLEQRLDLVAGMDLEREWIAFARARAQERDVVRAICAAHSELWAAHTAGAVPPPSHFAPGRRR